MQSRAIGEAARYSQLAAVGLVTLLRVRDQQLTRHAIVSGIDIELREAAQSVEYGFEQPGRERPVRAHARLGDEAIVHALGFVVGPPLSEVAAPRDLRRQVGICSDDRGRHFLVTAPHQTPERSDLHVLAWAPTWDDRGAQIGCI